MYMVRFLYTIYSDSCKASLAFVWSISVFILFDRTWPPKNVIKYYSTSKMIRNSR